MSDDSKLKPVLFGALLISVLGAFPGLRYCVSCLCCAHAVGGGFLAAHLWIKRRGSVAKPPYGDAAFLGVLAGALGGFGSSLLSVPSMYIENAVGLNDALARWLERVAEGNPGALPAIEALRNPQTDLGSLLISTAMAVPLAAVLAMLGGLLAVAIFFKKPPSAAAAWTPPAGVPPSVPPAWVPSAPPVSPPAPSPTEPSAPADEPWPPPPPPSSGGERS